MSVDLITLTTAVQDQLGDDLNDFIPTGFIERSLNEAQRRAEPDLLKDKSITVSLASGATTYVLPTDCREILDLTPDENIYYLLPEMREHGDTLYFRCALTDAWTGRLFYRASYPKITPTQECELPGAAPDALVSFALYRCYHRVASNRAEFRKFATIAGNGVSIGDLQNAAEAHLQDYKDAVASATDLPLPESW